MPATRTAFLALVAAVALERLYELVVSTRNARRALARGGVEAESRAFYALMVLTHAAFLLAAAVEVTLRPVPFLPALGFPMLGLTLGAMALRYWAVNALGESWNTRVIVVPGDPAIAAGPYRFVRHPNYVAVTVEMFALPLFHTAWRTAVVFSAANALLLWRRIAHEERALRRYADYETRLAGRGRFLPGARGR